MQPILFDANGPVGCGATAEPDFPTCRDLLRQMDRLGIVRALPWSTQARDHHPSQGNARLLKELDALGPERERLVPSLVISPTMLYERGSVEELLAMMRSRRVRALRAFPRTLRFRLRHLEPLLEKLVQFRPVLFVDTREIWSEDDRDVLSLADAFPQMPIVCMHAMWPHLFNLSLLDLLRRRRNIFLDNSWLHCRGTMEMIVREFGVERLVFGSGLKSHNGASIGHLLYADVTAEEREQIAHANLERLLGLDETKPLANAPPGAGRAASLWDKFRAGEPLGLQIIDAHGHLGAVGFWPMQERELADQIPAALRCMDRLGIRTLIVSGEHALFGDPVEGNRKLQEEAGAHGDRFRGYFGFNPHYAKELTPRLGEFFAQPFFVGLKILCDYWQVPATDPRFEPALRFAQEHRLPILYHTWQGPFDSPAMLKDIVKAYPDVSFLLGHSGGGDPGRREAEELTLANRNVHMEWCGSFTSRMAWEETIQRVGSDRVVFGSDGIFHDFAWELGRFVSLELPTERLLPILGENMRRILAQRR